MTMTGGRQSSYLVAGIPIGYILIDKMEFGKKKGLTENRKSLIFIGSGDRI
jgi:hypothetical protein